MAATKQDALKPTQRFWKMVATDAKEIRNVYYYAIFAGLVNLSLPLGIQAIVNLIQGGRVSSAWIVLVVFVVVGVALNGTLQIFQLRITENLQQKIYARASFEFAYRLPRIKLVELVEKFAPEMTNRFFDTINIQKGIAKILITISTAALQVIFGLILLSLYHEFFIVFGVFLVLLLYFIFRYFGPKGLQTSIDESTHKYKTAYWLEEVARTHKTFKLAGNTTLPFTRTDKHVSAYIDARENHFKVLVGQWASLVVFKVIVAAGLLAIGGILVMEQVMNIGQFVAAEIIILLIISSVEKLIVSLDTIYDVLTGMEKIGQVTDLELEKSEGLDLMKECSDQEGLDVDMDKIYFTYPGTTREVLKNVRLSFEKHEHVMISGKNESGKSAIIELLAGMYDPDEGVISYQGFPIENLNIETLRSTIGTCLSSEELFHATLLENITVGREGATFDRVKKVCEKLGISEFIKKLPHGYETMIKPGTDILSEEMIYKLLIARAIVDNPKVILFEYTFEHFDDKQRKLIIDYLLDKENGWTFIASSNDHYLAQRCDRVVIMSGGRVRQIGDYDQVKDEL